MPMSNLHDEIVRMEDISGSESLRHVFFSAFKKSVTGVLGLNHSGKTELVRILCGWSLKRTGRIYIENKLVEHPESDKLAASRLRYVDSENALITNFTVAENILVMQAVGKKLLFNKQHMIDECETLFQELKLNEIGIELKASQDIESLGSLEKLVVLIIRAYIFGADIIIIDHLIEHQRTESIPKLRKLLCNIIDSMNVTFILVDHHATSLISLCDQIQILRDGQNAGVFEQCDYDVGVFHKIMIGNYPIAPQSMRREPVSSKKVLSFSDVIFEGGEGSLCFDILEGEAVGICTLSNTLGQSLIECLYGLAHRSSGEIVFDDKPIGKRGTASNIFSNIGIVSDGNCIFPNLNVIDNLLIKSLRSNSYFSVINARDALRKFDQLNDNAKEMLNLLQVEAGFGNRKTVDLFRNLATNPRLLLFSNLDSGMDLVAYRRILDIIRKNTDPKQSILMITANVNSLLPICNRVYFVHEGRSIFVVDTRVKTYAKITTAYNKLCTLDASTYHSVNRLTEPERP